MNDVHRIEYDGDIIIPHTATSSLETWRAYVTLNDGVEDSKTGSGCETIGNHAPTVVVDVMPDNPTATQPLLATYDTSDEDRDLVTVVITWTVNGSYQSIVGNAMVIASSNTVPGELWCAFVTPHDGFESGETTQDCEIIDNHPPTATVNIDPDSPYTVDLLMANVISDDIDGHTISNEIIWTVDSNYDPTHDGDLTISAGDTTVLQEWCAFVTPHDGFEYGISDHDCVTILPQLTYRAYVTVTPEYPTTDQTLHLEYRLEDSDGCPRIPSLL